MEFYSKMDSDMAKKRKTKGAVSEGAIEKNRILILDNEPEMDNPLINYLWNSGYDTIAVAGIRNIKTTTNKFKPDLVIVNLDPGRPDYLKHNLAIARNLAAADIPAIHLVCGCIKSELETLNKPPCRCVEKPISGKKLLRLIKQTIGK